MAYTTIDKPTDYFNTNLYTGNNTETSHTVGFQPDWTWLKVRNADGSHYLFDSVRGVTKYIQANSTAAEGTDSNLIKSFDANGYTIGTSNAVNTTGETMVGWNWKAGGSASSNTDGSITSSVSANQDAGFSIVSYTGTGSNATVGHGLGAEAKCIIVKDRDNTRDWGFYHVSLGNGHYMNLNAAGGSSATSTHWNNTTPTSSVFSIGTSNQVNVSSTDFIAYCFADVKGYSKFGSYTGNGNANGTFVYTGFKPAWVMVKRSNNTQGWYMLDNKRNTFNPEDKYLEANDSDAEATFTFCDFLSNGFKARVDNTGTGFNFSGDTYIYMAFAEEPFVTSTGVPTTAR